ncbi:MAG: hypothetical protein HUU41_04550 [Bryobacteraceae bacterium]|nr:hypothetical protein [Bryobacterales bacterium]MEB2361184.1 hypothetical protein [Bryobacterales bacterium]NUN00360.1 hypothetical protein [Bryobacteraceae bacterium]
MLVVVGGHSRNIGKTSVAAGIIAALPEVHWTAVKITQHGHGICSPAGTPCDCAVEYSHPFALDEEKQPGGTDSGRFLAAGAKRAYWLRTPSAQLGHAIPSLRKIIESSPNTIIESNSVLQFLRPDLYIVVADYTIADRKESSWLYMDRADAFVEIQRGAGPPPPPWPDVPHKWLDGKPRFRVIPPDYVPLELADFVRQRLTAH